MSATQASERLTAAYEAPCACKHEPAEAAAPEIDPAGQYAQIQRMLRFFVQNQGLGMYVAHSAIPTGKVTSDGKSIWSFYTRLDPRSGAQRREVDDGYLQQVYTKRGANEAGEAEEVAWDESTHRFDNEPLEIEAYAHRAGLPRGHEGIMWVANLPGHGGVDWGYTQNPKQALLLSPYWQKRFKADMYRVGSDAIFVAPSAGGASEGGEASESTALESVGEPGMVWRQRPDGVWHASGDDGTYYAQPTPAGSYRVTWMGRRGNQREFPGRFSLSRAMQIGNQGHNVAAEEAVEAADYNSLDAALRGARGQQWTHIGEVGDRVLLFKQFGNAGWTGTELFSAKGRWHIGGSGAERLYPQLPPRSEPIGSSAIARSAGLAREDASEVQWERSGGGTGWRGTGRSGQTYLLRHSGGHMWTLHVSGRSYGPFNSLGEGQAYAVSMDRLGVNEGTESAGEAPAAAKGWANGRPSHAQIWANGKPLTIVQKGPRAWTLLVMNHPVVDLPDGGVTFHGRANFVHGLPEHVFTRKQDAESAAFSIGQYMLGLGAFMDTYVHHATAGGAGEIGASEAPAAAVAEGSVCRPWVRMEKDPAAFNACMALANKLGPIEGHDRLYEIVRQQMQREDQEVFYAIVLDTHLELRAMSEISRGGRDRVPTPMPDLARMAAYQAIYYGGMGLGVAHCHPSGKPKPSKADGEVTKSVEDICNALGIMFVDHLVIGATGHGYYSFRKKKIFRG